jgi:hypothetical protein
MSVRSWARSVEHLPGSPYCRGSNAAPSSTLHASISDQRFSASQDQLPDGMGQTNRLRRRYSTSGDGSVYVALAADRKAGEEMNLTFSPLALNPFHSVSLIMQ